jgi:PAS domain S-box-containing protein
VQFSLTKKILVVVGIFLMAQLALFWQMDSLSRQADNDLKEAMRAKEFTDRINEFTEEFYRFTRTAYDIKQVPSEQLRVLRELTETLGVMQKRARALSELAGGDRSQRIIRDAQDSLKRVMEITDGLKERLATLKSSSDIDWPTSERRQFRSEIMRIKEVSMLGFDASEEMNKKFEQHKQRRLQTHRLLVVGLIFVAVWMVASLFLLVQFVSLRVLRLQRNFFKFGAGVPLDPPIGGKDELGQLDAEFRTMVRLLEETRVKERSLLDRTASLVCSLDSHGKVSAVSASSSSMLGYEPDEIVGLNVVNLIDQGDSQRVREHLLDGARNSPSVEATLIRKNKTRVETLWSVRFDESSKSSLCVIHDVTEMRKDERNRKDLIALITEELQHPLNSIKTFLVALSDDRFGSQNEQGKALLELAMRSTKRMSGLVGDLLDAEKIKTGAIDLDLKVVSVNDILASSVFPLRNWAKEHGVEIICESSELRIRADEDRIGRVLTNLVSNAVKYSQKGKSVSIDIQPVGDFVEFSVSDEGRGIEAKVIDTLFEPFTQAHVADRKTGTGLGLSICKEIVALHGGSLVVSSEVGRGSVFRFTVPASD